MRLAILSDIHDHHANLRLVLDSFVSLGVERILCLGDFVSPPIVKAMIAMELPLDMIWGNNDGEVYGITTIACATPHVRLAKTTYASWEYDGVRVFATHYPDLAQLIAQSEMYDLVVYGHDHTRSVAQVGEAIVANPGAICGDDDGVSSFGICDTQTRTFEHVVV